MKEMTNLIIKQRYYYYVSIDACILVLKTKRVITIQRHNKNNLTINHELQQPECLEDFL